MRRDRVDAIVFETVSEAEALLPVRSLRMSSEPETALEQGWLRAEVEAKPGNTIDHLARRFDRSPIWVARRLSLVETLSESVQRQLREVHIAPQIAMRYLAPTARMDAEQCKRMAQVFAQRHRTTRQAVDFYNAWHNAKSLAREWTLAEPDLFLKARQRPHLSKTVLEGDLGQIVAIARRALERTEEPVPSRRTLGGRIQQATRLLNHMA